MPCSRWPVRAAFAQRLCQSAAHALELSAEREHDWLLRLEGLRAVLRTVRPELVEGFPFAGDGPFGKRVAGFDRLSPNGVKKAVKRGFSEMKESSDFVITVRNGALVLEQEKK